MIIFSKQNSSGIYCLDRSLKVSVLNLRIETRIYRQMIVLSGEAERRKLRELRISMMYKSNCSAYSHLRTQNAPKYYGIYDRSTKFLGRWHKKVKWYNSDGHIRISIEMND